MRYAAHGAGGKFPKMSAGAWHYDDSDIERLSMIMTLHDVGFTNEEVHQYMSLWVQGEATREERKKCWFRKETAHWTKSIDLRRLIIMSNLYETDAEFMERFEQFAYNEVVNEKDQQLEGPVRDLAVIIRERD